MAITQGWLCGLILRLSDGRVLLQVLICAHAKMQLILSHPTACNDIDIWYLIIDR